MSRGSAGCHDYDGATPEALLRRRSEELARRQLTPPREQVWGEVIVARRAVITLAVLISVASEVRLVEVVAVPGAGRVVAGVFQLRGRVYSLVDPAPLLAADRSSEPLCHGQHTLVLLLCDDGRELGLRIDEIVGPRRVLENEIDMGLQEQALVSCVTRDLVHILDVKALLASPAVQPGEPGQSRA